MCDEYSEIELLQPKLTEDVQQISCLLVLHDYSISCQKWRKDLLQLLSSDSLCCFVIPESRSEALELIKNSHFDVITIELKKSSEFSDNGYSFTSEVRKAGFKGPISYACYPTAPIEN